MTGKGFDYIAPVYDGLAALVFGNRLRRAQEYFLPEITTASHVLIMGGGTGHILQTLAGLNRAMEIYYVEASARMLHRARRRATHPLTIHWIQGTQDDIPAGLSFDVIITPFFLDMFDHELPVVMNRLEQHTHADTRWLATDFVQHRWWHGLMLRVMYIFFGWTTGLSTRRLPAWEQYFKLHWREMGRAWYYGRFITTIQYRKR